jgi:hypothetical protein
MPKWTPGKTLCGSFRKIFAGTVKLKKEHRRNRGTPYLLLMPSLANLVIGGRLAQVVLEEAEGAGKKLKAARKSSKVSEAATSSRRARLSKLRKEWSILGNYFVACEISHV